MNFKEKRALCVLCDALAYLCGDPGESFERGLLLGVDLAQQHHAVAAHDVQPDRDVPEQPCTFTHNREPESAAHGAIRTSMADWRMWLTRRIYSLESSVAASLKGDEI